MSTEGQRESSSASRRRRGKRLLTSRTLLTPRQVDCLCLAALGGTSAEIAEILGIAARTVDQHLAEAGERLNARDRMQSVVMALSLRLILTLPN